MYPFGRLRDYHTGSSMLPASPVKENSNSRGEWSGKRKLSASDRACDKDTPDTANLGDNPANSTLSNPQDVLIASQCNNGNKLWGYNNDVSSRHPTETNSQEIRTSVQQSSFSGTMQSHCKESASFFSLSTGQILTVPNQLPPVYGNFNHYEAGKSSLFIENAQSAGHGVAYSNYGHYEHLQSDCMPQKVYDDASNPSENLKQKLVEPFSPVGADILKEGSHSEISQKHSRDVSGAINPSAMEKDSAGSTECFMEHENADFEQREFQLVADNSTSYYQGDAGAQAGTMKIEVQSETRIPPKSVEIVHSRTGNTKSDGGPVKSSERIKSTVTSTPRENLWDGSLQLSSSITVLVAAYFKSGEKVPDVSWPKHVEVKGKTRLDAFEKYIQDLPRSRSRGLTVLSLCWKEGSSNAGLKAMKELARKYEQGEKVGFARLSSGFDLYICPPTETIFKILEKHGFVKGMLAFDKDQDPLIGCAVWRKITAFESAKRSVKIGSQSVLSSSSPSSSFVQQVAVKDSSKADLNQATVQLTSEKKQAAVEDIGKDGREGKSIESSDAQEIGNSSSSVTPVSLGLEFSSIHNGGTTLSPEELASVQDIMKKLSEIEASILQSLGVEKQTGNLELLKSVLPPPTLEVLKSILPPPVAPKETSLVHDAPKETSLVPDDDDLPEFDFKAAVSGIPSCKEVNHERIPSQVPRNINGSPLGVRGHLQGASIQMASEFVPRHTKEAKQGENSEKNTRPFESQVVSKPVLQGKENVTCSQTMTTLATSPTLGTRSKNIFDDDDDMPEWQPPNSEQPMPLPQAQKTGSLGASSTLKVPNPLCVNSTSANMPPFLPTPAPSVQFQFSAQATPYGHHQPTPFTKEAAPLQPTDVRRYWGLRSSTEVSSLKPQFNPHQLTPPPQPADVHRHWGPHSSTEVSSSKPQFNPHQPRPFTEEAAPPQPADVHTHWRPHSSTEVRPQFNPCNQSCTLSTPLGGVAGCRDRKRQCRSSNSSSEHLCRRDCSNAKNK